jgi:hypothetical protein
MALLAIRQNNISSLKKICLTDGFDITFNKFVMFRVAAERGQIEAFQLLIGFMPVDYPMEKIYIICMDAALLAGRLEMAEFIFQKYPAPLSTLESHLRLFYYIGGTHECKMLNFLVTHYFFSDDSINSCFESLIELGRVYFLNVILNSSIYSSVIKFYIRGDRFDWVNLSSDTLSYECIGLVIDRIKQDDAYAYADAANLNLTENCIRYLHIRQRSRNKAATRIQTWFKQNVAYKLGSISCERLAMEEWLKLG